MDARREDFQFVFINPWINIFGVSISSCVINRFGPMNGCMSIVRE